MFPWRLLKDEITTIDGQNSAVPIRYPSETADPNFSLHRILYEGFCLKKGVSIAPAVLLFWSE